MFIKGLRISIRFYKDFAAVSIKIIVSALSFITANISDPFVLSKINHKNELYKSAKRGKCYQFQGGNSGGRISLE